MSRASATRAGAFTLFEVLAAVALLGILFTTLAGVASTWLRAEGEARRRFEASLKADVRLGELEAEVAAGRVPAPGEGEARDDPYRITTRVEPLRPPVELLEVPGQAPAPAAPTLFPGQGSTFSPPLRLIEVRVSWDEGAEERHVERTTLAFDLAAAAPALTALSLKRDSQRAGAGQGAPPQPTPGGVAPPSGGSGPGGEELPRRRGRPARREPGR